VAIIIIARTLCIEPGMWDARFAAICPAGEETLMAYADGELEEAYSAELSEGIPDGLLTAARGAGGALVARGQLAKALSNQLAAEQSRNSTVRIGLSYLAKTGDYCRTFALSGTVSPSGLACRHGEEWGQIAGEPLDQAGERAARERGWTAADHHAP
jgi:hypothetical protein